MTSTARQLPVCAAILLLLLTSCVADHRSQPLANDAYIWQRHWDDALLTALSESGSSIRAWRVLAAESKSTAELTKIIVNRQALHQMQKPVVAVIRIDGRSGVTLLGNTLVTESVALATDWKKDGIPVRGIEIDYDCATARLKDYQDFLRLLREDMPKNMTLSITALPSWMASNDLPKLLTEVDETILQVHSVMNPSKGLFDRASALRWAQEWSTLSPVPFRLALPTYWSRVSWNEQGQVSSIESEVDRYGSDPKSRELVVDPNEVALLIAELKRKPPENLVGIAWFRLPTASDHRAWTARTWHAVMLGEPLQAALPIVHFKVNKTGVRDIYLLNESGLDAKLPSRVAISGKGCEFADAMPPYNLQRQMNLVQFFINSDDLLRSGEERLIGWIRCSSPQLEAHVSH